MKKKRILFYIDLELINTLKINSRMSNKNKILINDTSPIELEWSNNGNFLKHLRRQQKEPFVTYKAVYTPAIEQWANTAWKRYQNKFKLYSSLPNNANILDIGCGCAIMDLIAAKYNNTFNFYLLDKHELELESKFVWFADKHSFYHSWDVVEDFITSSNLNKNKINFINPDTEWPEELDLVTSFFSWGFHYPLQNEFGYWEKTLKSLKKGGRLYMDFSNNNLNVHPNSIEFISDCLKSTPIILPYTTGCSSPMYYEWKDNAMGYGCLWTKNI
jgi:hypothetical protein